jgi:hypothetical protein
MRPLAGLSLVFLLFTLAACRDQSRSGEVGTVNIGERAQVGPLIYTVLDTQWMVSMGEENSPRLPSNRFFIVNITIVNGGGKEAVSVPTFSLIDDNGKTYTELESGDGVPQWLGFVRKIRPADTTQGNIIFDVPQKHFKLRVADDTDTSYGYIDIPLNFGVPPPKVVDAPAPPRLSSPK